MRNGQNKRMRGRNRKGQNPLTRVYESNGPDVKIRGTPSHVAEKYVQLARDAQTSGDPVAAENYFQHAEHYFRLIAAAQEQFRQSQPYFRPEGEQRGEDHYDGGGDDESGHPMGDAPYAGRESQPYGPREPQSYQQQPYPPREQPYGPREPQAYGGRPQPSGPQGRPESGEVDRLPSFITGGGGQPQPPTHQGYGPNGFDGQPDRFPLHRRRRRRHGPRPDMHAGPPAASEAPDEPAPQGPPGEPHRD